MKNKKVRIQKGKNTASLSFSCSKEMAQQVWDKAEDNDLSLSQYIRKLVEYDLKHNVLKKT